MKAEELAWAMLPEGLEPYFEIEDCKYIDQNNHSGFLSN
jgi:hypothetical protein